MRLPLSLVLALLAPRLAFTATPAKRFYDTYNYYVLEHNPIGVSLVDIIRALDVELVEQAGELKDHWLVKDKKPEGLAARDDSDRILERFEHLRSLANHQNSIWSRSEDSLKAREIVDSVPMLERQVLRRRVKRAPPPVRPTSSRAVAERFGISDPLFSKQWHLVNDEYPEHMMNVTGVWEMGLTGKGIISSLVDDGLDYTALDLKDNFDAVDSHDFNDHVDLPTPKNYDDHHGTRCAGQIAAGKNNYCGMGIAYESKVAGVRILSGPITDVDEAAALNFGFQNVSIYSCSWGPPDNGRSMEGPSQLIKKAVLNGINNGRDGKGSVFVFASGNGAAHGDQCNFDGYTNSIYSVTVSAVDYKGIHPYYSEPCAANMIVAYSSGSGKHIVTTDRGENECAETHGGTSAAAPNAVGVFALALQARPDLTWRDIQYLCVKTAKIINPDDSDWDTTATGLKYSNKYGFGALDGYAYVKAAMDWKLVKPQAWFKTNTVQLNGGTMNAKKNYTGGEFIVPGGVKSTITISEDMLLNNNFEDLEHINVKVWISHGKRGDVEVELTSPNGVTSILGQKRHNDLATTGYPGWIFMTVKHWGENPIGDWTLKVTDQAADGVNGSFLGWNMMLWGSTIDADLADQYILPPDDHNVLPPFDELSDHPVATTTITYTKPIHFLTDHLPTSTSTTSASTATGTPTADVGWFSEMGSLVSNQKWFFGAIGAVVIFGIGVGVFFWRRRVARLRRAEYRTLAAEDGSMTGVERHALVSRAAPRTKELYDAFGEMSDDEDADEATSLRPGPHRREGLGFHSGFLDDDEPSSAGPRASTYKDEPEPGQERERERDKAASPSGSGDGSWEHASSS